MRVGFTGTQRGMTEDQFNSFTTLMEGLRRVDEFHHGVCVGSDTEAHQWVRTHKISTKTILHPPLNKSLMSDVEGSETKIAKDYLDRNRDIVDETDILIGTPETFTEQIRSGTWYTIRYARKKNKPIVIIDPSGSIHIENIEKLDNKVIYYT